MPKPITRVKEIISYKKISISAFEKAIGMSNNSIQTAIKRNANLKDDTLNNILKAFPDISAEWLLTGNGTMLIAENASVVTEPSPDYDDDHYIIELQREYIVKLKEEIRQLKSNVN